MLQHGDRYLVNPYSANVENRVSS